ncbi:hypothetical protein TcasGA2_TC008034 [Tribolium castaneum]|uniref:Uncharacterized protein n=1 Tax=Tribolium castaneum TaxID=7070 RepID=D1ZZF3_TRICA|nr:hypothetical protein TcasGA2_TC008034 [Tribolium castaneum]
MTPSLPLFFIFSRPDALLPNKLIHFQRLFIVKPADVIWSVCGKRCFSHRKTGIKSGGLSAEAPRRSDPITAKHCLIGFEFDEAFAHFLFGHCPLFASDILCLTPAEYLSLVYSLTWAGF